MEEAKIETWSEAVALADPEEGTARDLEEAGPLAEGDRARWSLGVGKKEDRGGKAQKVAITRGGGKKKAKKKNPEPTPSPPEKEKVDPKSELVEAVLKQTVEYVREFLEELKAQLISCFHDGVNEELYNTCVACGAPGQLYN